MSYHYHATYVDRFLGKKHDSSGWNYFPSHVWSDKELEVGDMLELAGVVKNGPNPIYEVYFSEYRSGYKYKFLIMIPYDEPAIRVIQNSDSTDESEWL